MRKSTKRGMQRHRMFLAAMCLTLFSVGAGSQTFDTATIKQYEEGQRSPLQADASHLSASGITLRSLILQAYSIQEFQLKGAPDWVDQQLFSVQASVASPATHDELMRMLRSFLLDRFQLEMQETSRSQDVLRLEIAPGGLRARPPSGPKPPRATEPGDSLLPFFSTGQVVRFLNSPSMAQYLGRPVVYGTALTGPFDLSLMIPTSMGTPNAEGQPHVPGAPKLEEVPGALQQQLGLRLVPFKASIDLYTIVRVAKLDRMR